MTSKSSSALAFAALLANLAFVATGCGSYDSASADPTIDSPARDTAAADAPTAPPVGGTPSTNELTDELGVFVSNGGQPNAEGTHAHPLASIQAGIDLAKRGGKRVYVCAGTFRESLTLADSISLIGGLDCTAGEWRTGAKRTRVESPSSPAVVAANIKSATRVEGFEVVAPNAAQPSGSSIGLLATHASSLVIAGSVITAGNGMKGDDGADGVQLADSPTANGAPATPPASCANDSSACLGGGGWVKPRGAAGGTNTCTGAAGHAAQAGGTGGSSGIWEPAVEVGTYRFNYYAGNASYGSDLGGAGTGAPGRNGADGANAPAIGGFTVNGYTAASGTVGADGAPGLGGAGGAGRTPEPDINPAVVAGVWRGYGGAGGGAGGCPGLAGSAGKGGGASIAALLVDSPVTFESTELRSLTGGDAGRGSLGSAPTAGGHRGFNVYYTFTSGRDGGMGGSAGVSGNGSNGPSIGIAHIGAAPDVRPSTKITLGAGGAAIPARTRNTLGVVKTIPATPAGLSKDILAL